MNKKICVFCVIIFLAGCKSDNVKQIENVEINNCHYDQPLRNEHDLPCKEGETFEGLTIDGEQKYGVCFTSSGCEGKICKSKKDCGRSSCKFTKKDIFGENEGVCTDFVLGCKKWIDDEGNVEEMCNDI